MELEQLRQFDAIARQGTMSAAARALHLSQPALSRSLARIVKARYSMNCIHAIAPICRFW